MYMTVAQLLNAREWLRNHETPKRRHDFVKNVLIPFRERTTQGDGDRRCWYMGYLFKAQEAETIEDNNGQTNNTA